MAELFYQTVHHVNLGDYSREQVNAWATGQVDLEEWDSSFSEHVTVLAEENGRIIGFGDMSLAGYLDRLYVHKDYQRQRIGTMICDELESRVSAFRYWTQASITAKPFFLSRGYRVVREQNVERCGVLLTNYVMEKGKTVP